MQKVAFIKTQDGNITLILGAKNFSIGTSHANYNAILAALKSRQYDGLEDLLDVPATITNRIGVPTGGAVSVRDGQVFYHGLPMHNTVTERIMAFLSQGLPIEPLVRFLENLMANPMPMAVAELYDFLEHRGFPITEDGCFVGYKAVNQDWTDIHSRTNDNSPGKTITMGREKVDPDRRNECSHGLHVGTLEYATSFARGGKIVLVKVNPRDCIAVPKDHDCSKLRVCQYEVLSEAQGRIETPMYPMPEQTPAYEEEDEEDFDQDEDAYEAGKEAFEDNLALSDNPYPQGIDDFYLWSEGWNDASDAYPATTTGTFNSNVIANIKITSNVPKRPPCSSCGSRGGKAHKSNCKRRKS